MIKFNNMWDDILHDEFEKEYYQKIRSFLVDEYNHHIIYPKMENIFNALKLTDYKDVKVVILGQDPYHEPNQAHGLCFSVENDALPPSLVNIYKELHDDIGFVIPKTGNLEPWAKQGVLLLNTTLTVRKGEANSHSKIGWNILTDYIISKVNEKDTPVVFILWGRNARDKKALITNPKHLILECSHPSPLSAYHGFFGCKHFSKTNEFLKANNLEPINWQL